MEDIFFLIASYKHSFTSVEEVIAEYFMGRNESLTISKLAKKISVSESSITRFSKKIGFNNYKELIFVYEKSLENEDSVLPTSLKIYNKYSKIFEIVEENYSEEKVDVFCDYINKHKVIHFIGKGFNNFAALNFQFRMYRLNRYIFPVSDDQSIRLAMSQVPNDELVIVCSISGEDSNFLHLMKKASERNVPILLITANKSSQLIKYSREVLITSPLSHNQSLGNISPQIPVLIQLDILYEKYLHKYEKSVQQWLSSEEILKEE